MGIGDDIIATSMARGAAARGKRVAFGDGRRIIWGPHSATVFAHNPNVAAPGSERDADIEWMQYHKGHRVYNSQGDGRWLWNYDFRVRPGEFFLTDKEKSFDVPNNLVMIEPNVPDKPCAPNKQWPIERWRRLAEILSERGFAVRQFGYGGRNGVAPSIATSTFRRAAGLLARSPIAILPEGGLHHAAAAVGTPAVVLFGGFVSPSVFGYCGHVTLTGGAGACGSFTRCEHCVEAMRKISVDEVVAAATEIARCR